MSLGNNLLAGLLNSIWSAIITLLSVPLYLKLLGAESYGLIGFFITTQALLTILDLGLSSTINREVARNNAVKNKEKSADLLQMLAIIYWAIAAVIGISMLILSPWIAHSWLQSKNIDLKTLSTAVSLIGLVLACRWPIALYQGALLGAQKQVLQSSINIIMVTMSNLGAILVLMFLSKTIQAYFIWQAVVGMIYVLTIRFFALKEVGKPDHFKFDILRLKSIWRFSAGMSGIALAGLALTQLDKVMLSKMLPLEAFGNYMLATLLVSGLYLLITPFYNLIYPRFSYLAIRNDEVNLYHLYSHGSRLLAAMLFSTASLLVVYSYDIVNIWTGDPNLALKVSPLVSILAMGSALHGVMYFPFALLLAYGKTNLALKINGLLLLLLAPLIYILTLKYGALGAALSWLVLHIIYVLFGTFMTHQALLKGIGTQWLLKDVGTPLLISIALGLFSYFYIVTATHYSSFWKVAIGMLILVFGFILSISTSPTLRSELIRYSQLAITSINFRIKKVFQ